MASASENKDFAAALLSTRPLDEAIDWIKTNLRPEEVFDENELGDWACENGFTRDGCHD